MLLMVGLEPVPSFSSFSWSDLIFSPEQLDLKTVSAEGVGRQVLLDSGFSGNAQEEVRRVSLGVAEQRGFSSPVRGCGSGKGISDGATGTKEGGGGLVKKRRKSWIKVKQVKNYAVGEDIAWGSVLQMAKFTLVGRVLGRNFCRKTVADWVEEHWKGLLGYSPVVVMLNRGWFAFNFFKEEDLRRVLNKNWHLNHSPMLLKPWHPLFDASRERVDVIPIWVRMPALPLHF